MGLLLGEYLEVSPIMPSGIEGDLCLLVGQSHRSGFHRVLPYSDICSGSPEPRRTPGHMVARFPYPRATELLTIPLWLQTLKGFGNSVVH